MSQEHNNPGTQKPDKPNKPVVVYIMILFIAAFLLMALSFFMHQRSNTEALGQLQNSVSMMQELQAAQEKIIALQDELDETKEALDKAEEALEAAEDSRTQELQVALAEAAALADEQSKTINSTQRAMDLFWQINEAFVLNRPDRCRELIQALEADVLAPYLPSASTTGNGRFSPYDRYAEICEALKEPYGVGVKS